MLASVDLQEADLSNLEPCASIALLGKRRTGKTTWAKYILESLSQQIDRFVALCGNKDNSAEWKRIISPLYVVPKNLSYLKKLRDYQDMKVAKYTEMQQPVPRKYRVALVLDDCGSDRSFMHSPIMKDILSNGRHYGMTILILCQYLNQMHAENRDQIDYLGMLYTSNQRNIRKVHEEYVNICDFRTYKYILNACTSHKGLCWIDNTRTPSTVDECVFFKRLKLPRVFPTIGGFYVRQYADHHYMERPDVSPSDANVEKEKPSYSGKRTAVDGVDTDSSDDEKILQQDILADKCVFTDKMGSFVVRKQLSKQKTE